MCLEVRHTAGRGQRWSGQGSQGCERDLGVPGRAGPGREPALGSRPQVQKQGARRRPGHLCETPQLAVCTDACRFSRVPSDRAEDSGSASRALALTHPHRPAGAPVGPQPLAT